MVSHSPARELLTHRLDHLPPARDHLQRLRHVFSDLRHPLRPAAGAGGRPRHHHPLARQMFGEGLARRLATDEPLHLGRCCCRLLGREIVLAGVGREIVEGELELVEQALLALGPRNHRAPDAASRSSASGKRSAPRPPTPAPAMPQALLRGLQRRSGPCRSWGRERIRFADPWQLLIVIGRPDCIAGPHPARDGRQVRTGLRHSIPSSR